MTMITESQAVIRPRASIGVLTSMANHIAAYRRSRHALRDFAAMDDHILRDIGLSRADVVRAAAAEFGTDRMAVLDHARARNMA